MADRVAVLKDGLLMQCATPRELFTRPDNLFVAGFIGSPAMNLLEGTVSDGIASAGSLEVPLTPEQSQMLTSAAVTIGVRPENLITASEGGLDAGVIWSRNSVRSRILYCTADGIDDQEVVVRTEGLSSSQRGDKVSLVPQPNAVHLFDTATGSRLVDA